MKDVIFVFICCVVACTFMCQEVQSSVKELNTANNKNNPAQNSTTQIFEIGKPNKNSREFEKKVGPWDDFPCCLPSPYSHLAKGMDCEEAPSPCADLYEHTHLNKYQNGSIVRVSARIVKNASSFTWHESLLSIDNAVSSIVVHPGCTLKGYKEPGLKELLFSFGKGTYDNSGWSWDFENDQLSSWNCMCGLGTPCADLYQEFDLQGDKAEINVGEVLEAFHFPVAYTKKWDQAVSSIKVYPGCQLEGFHFPEFIDHIFTLKEGTYKNKGNGLTGSDFPNNKLGSWKCSCKLTKQENALICKSAKECTDDWIDKRCPPMEPAAFPCKFHGEFADFCVDSQCKKSTTESACSKCPKKWQSQKCASNPPRGHQVPKARAGLQKAIPNSLPWQVAIVTKDYYCDRDGTPCHEESKLNVLCGGAAICSKYVLTAAHCGDIFEKNGGLSNIIVLGGKHNLAEKEEGTQTDFVLEFHKHPNYTDFHDYDFGIVKLIVGFIFGGFIEGYKLPVQHTPFPVHHSMYGIFLPEPGDEKRYEKAGTRFLVSGWGPTLSGPLMFMNPQPEQHSHDLLTISLPFISEEKCKQFYPDESPWYITPRHMCTALEEENYCEGDSGAPIAWYDDHYDPLFQRSGRIKLVGLTTYAIGCGIPGVPSVNAKITTALDWIESVTSGCNRHTCYGPRHPDCHYDWCLRHTDCAWKGKYKYQSWMWQVLEDLKLKTQDKPNLR